MLRTVIFAICFVLAGPVVADSPRILRETRDERHVAVIGDGFLRAEDADETFYLLRSCTLAEDIDGQLCASVDGKLLKFVPPIVIPVETDRIVIRPDGCLSVIERGRNDLIQVGMFEVSFPRSREGMREIAIGVFVCDEHVTRMTEAFGEQSQAFVMQGWIDQGEPAASGR